MKLSNKNTEIKLADSAREPHRSVREIELEYSQVCMKAGHAQYQLYTIEKDLSAYNDTLRSLNIEAARAKAAEPVAKDETPNE